MVKNSNRPAETAHPHPLVHDAGHAEVSLRDACSAELSYRDGCSFSLAVAVATCALAPGCTVRAVQDVTDFYIYG